MACKPVSVSVAVVTPDDKREVQFGLTRGCNPDDSDFWTIDFILKQLKSGEMKTRVEVHVAVGENKKPKAQELANASDEGEELSPAKLGLLNNQIADLASTLTQKQAETSAELKALLLRVL